MSQTDAVLVRIPISNYRLAMLDIHHALSEHEVSLLKFLCELPVAKLEKCKQASDLLLALEESDIIGLPDNVQFLAETLFHIGRRDLLKHLNYSVKHLEAIVKNGQSRVSPYRRMLLDVCMDITSDDLKTLKFLCKDDVRHCETITSPHDLILSLEARLKIAENDFNYFKSCLNRIRRNDIIAKVERYQRSAASSSSVGNGREINKKQGNLLAGERAHGCGAESPSQCLQLAVQQPSSAADNRTFSRQESQRPLDSLQQNLDADHLNTAASSDYVDLPRYSMERHPRGLCLIINNEHFRKVSGDASSIKLPERTGTEFDKEKLKETFTNLGFIVDERRDLTAKEMASCLKDISMLDHRSYDCFICCILSHGACGTVYGSNGRTVAISDLTAHLKAVNCDSLRNKPKIFFIQACQGKQKQRGYRVETDSSSSSESVVANDADFLICLSTVPDCVSYRSPTEGSWFIAKLTAALDQYAGSHDLLSIMTKVNEEVQELSTLEDCKQVPQPTHTLKKKIFFSPIN